MKLYVRTVVLLSIALLFASCAERQNGGKQATAKIERLAVSLINGDKYVFGQNIDLQCNAESGAVIDSLSVSFGGRTMKFARTAKLSLPTNQASVGQHTIRITAWTADGSQAEGRAHVRIVSDVEPVRYTYKIIKQLPHNHDYYTQGLEFDGDYLYEGTGLEGRSALYKIDFQKQTVENSVALENQYFGEGVTVLGEKVYQLTWRSFAGFVYNKNTLNKIAGFSYPTEGWGLANDGSNLIMSDGSEKIYFIDTASFSEVRRIEVYDNNGPVTMLNELEYVDGLIYANIYCSDYIVAIEPTSGKVLKIIDMRGLLNTAELKQRVDVLNGIAYQKSTNRWYVTGKLWPKMFQVEFVEKR
ncbi:MAG: glutaminyl-peptide cyclotransferase [Salinivirgaceae bacterium]|nr:glutaminyl-peptide cyclotransferase [Salinivirgaceae bacterium]